jgi:biopolymer transport protein ExbB/TolQ
MISILEKCLSRFSEALLLPTLAAVMVIGVWTALLVGGLLREWLDRRHVRRALQCLREGVNAGESASALVPVLATCRGGLPKRLHALRQQWPAAGAWEKCLEDLELEVTARLSRLSWITRVAPMLGLMGTLIPLGPALTGLAAGDIARLSSNLVVAFTATVAGVFLGSLAFSISVVRKGWYARDLSDLEYIFSRAGESES